MKKKYFVYLAGGSVIGFIYPLLRVHLGNDLLAIGVVCLLVVVLRLIVFWGFERH